MAACTQKAKTAFAEEQGRIALIIQREIMTGATWSMERIPEGQYDVSLGESPRTIRMQTAAPPRTEYKPFMAEGNESINFPSPADDSAISGFGDKKGRGCNLPAERIRWGYDVYNRCVRATALETDPMCLIDMLQKNAVEATISALRNDITRYAKEHFSNELLRQVIRLSYHKYSMAPGNPMNTNVPYFPAVPTGGLNIGVLRNIENDLRLQGWDKGSKTPSINGRPALQVYASRDSIEFAIVQRKIQLKAHLDSMITSDDKTFGQTQIYEGIQFIENPMPTRGYLLPNGSGFTFVEISPYTVRAGVEGIVNDPNDAYRSSYINVGGENYPVVEVGYIIHPMAMERQAMGNMPTVDGKTVRGKFNFEVNAVPDFAIVAPECNKDGFWIQWRMLHAYAPIAVRPELMTAFLYLAATPQVILVSPQSGFVTPSNTPVTMTPFEAPRLDGCLPCADTAIVRDPTTPTCDNIFPANGVGVIALQQSQFYVSEDAVGLTVVALRNGGSTGAASVAYTTANGTATQPTNYTTTAGTLNWADGEFGPKAVVVPINSHSGDDDQKSFTFTLSSATGATLGTPAVATITILDSDHA